MDEPVYYPREVPKTWDELHRWNKDIYCAKDPEGGQQRYAEDTYLLRECCGREYTVGGAYFSELCPAELCEERYCTCGADLGSSGPVDCRSCSGVDWEEFDLVMPEITDLHCSGCGRAEPCRHCNKGPE